MANNSTRKSIEFLVEGALPPHSTNVLWMDTSNPELPVLKIFKNGVWTPVTTDNNKTIQLLVEHITSLQEEITNLEEGIQATCDSIEGKVDDVTLDLSGVAKQGPNASATLAATQAAVVDGNDTAISVSKGIRSEVGTGSDTAAETGTVFSILKWIKDKAKSIFNIIGTPAQGQPSTLFAAIAAGGGGGSAAVPEISIADTGSAATQELAANTLYIFPNRTSDLTLTLGTPVTGEASEYHFIVEVGSTLPTITMPTGLTWKSSDTIAFDTDTTYEVSILDNYAIFVVW